MASDLARLKASAADAEKILSAAERSGMEVSSARLELADANEALIKARVSVHTFDPAEVEKLADQGAGISNKVRAAGVAALEERDRRRKGLGVSLIFVVMAIAGLYLRIRHMEASG